MKKKLLITTSIVLLLISSIIFYNFDFKLKTFTNVRINQNLFITKILKSNNIEYSELQISKDQKFKGHKYFEFYELIDNKNYKKRFLVLEKNSKNFIAILSENYELIYGVIDNQIM